MEYKKQNGNHFAEPGQNGNPLEEELTLSEEAALLIRLILSKTVTMTDLKTS